MDQRLTAEERAVIEKYLRSPEAERALAALLAADPAFVLFFGTDGARDTAVTILAAWNKGLTP